MTPANDDSIWLIPGESAEGPDREPTLRGDQTDFALGDHLAGRFEIRRCLGQGGMATVYEAYDRLRDEAVAVKFLIPSLLEDSEAVRQFRTEAAIATRLSHPHIVTVYDFHAVNDSYVIVMERLEGQTLRQLISDRQRAGDPFSPKEVEEILSPLCDALDYAHRFTIHRDVKPENVWITSEGSLKLMDFGLAKLVRRGADPLSLHTLTQLRLGSPYYIAPEQLHDAGQATAASDQFAVGVIAYELLAGELPIGLAKPLRQVRPDLSYELTDAVDRALSNDPAQRFPSINSFHEAFRHGVQARVGWAQRLETRPVLRRSLLGIGAVLVLGGLFVGTAEILNRRSEAKLVAAREAQDQLLEARSRLQNVRALIDDAAEQRDRTIAERDAYPADSADDSADLPTRLDEEIQLARLTRDAAVAETTWDWLALRVGPDEVPIDVRDRLAEFESAVRGRRFAETKPLHTALSEALEREISVLPAIRDFAESQHRLLALTRSERSPPSALVISDPAWQPVDDDWAAALAASKASEKTIRDHLQKQFEGQIAEREAARNRWTDLFPEVGPPPLEFMGYPEARARAASQWASLDRFDRAIPLLESSLAIVTGWAKEVEDLRERCEESWAHAKDDGRAFRNKIGMRFVRIEDHYWSVWETRVMDFARYAAVKDGEIAIPSFWRNPGFPLSPTQPVVGIPQNVAADFGAWLRNHFRGEPTDQVEHVLPDQQQFERTIAAEANGRELDRPRAINPNRHEHESMAWFDEYRDKTIDAGEFILPVALDPPSPSGLYDLYSNAWEWASDLRTLGGNEEFPAGEYQVLYGGGSFGEVSFHGQRPPAETRAVGRLDAHGFRIIIAADRLDEALEAQEEAE